MFVLKILPNMCESEERSCAVKVTSFPHEPCAPTPSADLFFFHLTSQFTHPGKLLSVVLVANGNADPVWVVFSELAFS